MTEQKKKTTKPYKELNLNELKLESMRLERILRSHPNPNTYKQAKKSLERINDLIARRLGELLLEENRHHAQN